jgi:predicted ATPase
MRAEILLALGAEAEAQNSLVRAIDIARRQSGKSLELRATVDLARLWLKQDKPDEALQILEPILSWFSEGIDTPDLTEAQALLMEVSESAGPQGSRTAI